MIKRLLQIFMLLAVPLGNAALAADTDVNADIAIYGPQSEQSWVGQQLSLNLDLKTTGLSFSNVRFSLPEVSGAFLMQTDTTTVKFTENIDGITWQVIRYPFALYPQKAGLLEVPPMAVRFSTSAGFGSEEKSFEFQTNSLSINIDRPPGVKNDALVVTTTDFELTSSWQPQTETAGSGDAFTLTVTRRAADISAMLLPPLPVFRTEGLATYPQAPEIEDHSNRGALVGVRTDSIIWVVEKPGSYNIPGIRFQWWDPAKQELQQQIVAGIQLDVLPTADEAERQKPVTLTIIGSAWQWLFAATLLAIIVGLWMRFGRNSNNSASNAEKAAFRRLSRACKNNLPDDAHTTIHQWLVCAPGKWTRHTTSLTDFALSLSNPQLRSQLEQLQYAVIDSNPTWQGSELLSTLQTVRRQMAGHSATTRHRRLATLNP